jgi:hypothetical protein
MPAQLFNTYLIYINEIVVHIKTGDGIQGGVSLQRKKCVPNVY